MHLRTVARMAWLFLSVGTATSARAQTPDTTRITATRLAEGIYVLMGQGGNIGLSTGPNGAFLIDDEYASDSSSTLIGTGTTPAATSTWETRACSSWRTKTPASG